MIMMSGIILSVSLNEVESPSCMEKHRYQVVITVNRFVETHFFSER